MPLARVSFKFLLFTLLTSLISCNVVNKYSRYPGISYIGSVGNPPADTLVWSPHNTNVILINANRLGYGTAQVYLLDIATKRKTVLSETDYGEIWATSWFPDGKQVVLTVAEATRGFSQPGLWAVNTEDLSTEFVLDKYGYAFLMPDEKFLGLLSVELATINSPRQVSFSLIDIQNKEEKTVYANDAAITFLGASLSLDGQKLVFSLNFRNGDANDLFILDVNSGKVTQLTHNGGSTFPAWSPRTSIIAYQQTLVDSGGKRKTTLHLINADGTCDLEIPYLEDVLSPTWSPDGTQIAFIGEDGIYVIDLDLLFGRDIYQNLCP